MLQHGHGLQNGFVSGRRLGRRGCWFRRRPPRGRQRLVVVILLHIFVTITIVHPFHHHHIIIHPAQAFFLASSSTAPSPAISRRRSLFVRHPPSFLVDRYRNIRMTTSRQTSRALPQRSEKVSSYDEIDTEEREGERANNAVAAPRWDPVKMIYVGGVIPENAAVKQMIEENQGVLRVFGYGSLCWNPGKPGSSALAHESVNHTLGRARGYRRCWAQRSTDHRGVPSFPGIVCTLLTEHEFQQFRPTSAAGKSEEEESLTEGLIYVVPPDLVDECLAELDFREKGGYARDIIEVVEDATGETVRALLYRGTPDNPAFWPRALKDLSFAAAVMSVAHGPSGENQVYLESLDQFLEEASEQSTLEKFDDTFKLTAMARALKDQYTPYFIYGSGSNQHNQLLLNYDDNENVADLRNGEDAHEMKEIMLCTERRSLDSNTIEQDDKVVQIYAGGGHSGVMTESESGRRLFLFGWNHCAQLGHGDVLEDHGSSSKSVSPLKLPLINDLDVYKIQDAALGFAHTLVLDTRGRVLAFGDNSKGQVSGVAPKTVEDASIVTKPTVLIGAGAKAIHVAAGLFHSAVITEDGDLITFGCRRYHQSLGPNYDAWRPPDGAKLVRAACGRRHTIVLDDRGRIFSMGDNTYGQIGRPVLDGESEETPKLVTCEGYKAFHVDCGWSHTVILARKDDDDNVVAFGWGRNDYGQLGNDSTSNVRVPTRLFESNRIRSISCGSESTMVVDGSDILGCGWNEHGNLSLGNTSDTLALTKISGARVTHPPGYAPDNSRLAIAAGGAHFLAMMVHHPK